MEVLPHDQISPGIPKLFIMTEYDLRFLTNKQTQAKTTTTKNKNHTQDPPQTTKPCLAYRSGSSDTHSEKRALLPLQPPFSTKTPNPRHRTDPQSCSSHPHSGQGHLDPSWPGISWTVSAPGLTIYRSSAVGSACQRPEQGSSLNSGEFLRPSPVRANCTLVRPRMRGLHWRQILCGWLHTAHFFSPYWSSLWLLFSWFSIGSDLSLYIFLISTLNVLFCLASPLPILASCRKRFLIHLKKQEIRMHEYT